MSNPYEGLQELVAEVPTIVQPLVVAAGATIPYIEGEGAAAFGVIAGVNPLVAAIAAATGNIISVVLVVLLGSRARTSVVASRSRRAAAAVPVGAGAPVGTSEDTSESEPKVPEPANRRAKGRRRLERWLVRFGVPGTSLLAPLALPTQLTAATFVASGVSKSWVILWQVVAIVLWTGVVTAVATGILSVVPS